jgi:hypothetical protein
LDFSISKGKKLSGGVTVYDRHVVTNYWKGCIRVKFLFNTGRQHWGKILMIRLKSESQQRNVESEAKFDRVGKKNEFM